MGATYCNTTAVHRVSALTLCTVEVSAAYVQTESFFFIRTENILNTKKNAWLIDNFTITQMDGVAAQLL